MTRMTQAFAAFLFSFHMILPAYASLDESAASLSTNSLISPRVICHHKLSDDPLNQDPIDQDQVLEGLITSCVLSGVDKMTLVEELNDIEKSLLKTDECDESSGITAYGLAIARSISMIRITKLKDSPLKLFAIKQIKLKPYNGRPQAIMAIYHHDQSRGYLNFFHWDSRVSDHENYKMITQTLYETGKTDLHQDHHIACIAYELGELESGTYTLHEQDGYEWKYFDKPIQYCYVRGLYVKEDYRNMGIGTRILRELADFMFSTRSADFLASSLYESNQSSLRAFQKNHFRSMVYSMDGEQENFRSYILWDHAGFMMKLFNTWFVPVCQHSFNYYLARKTWKAKLRNIVHTPRKGESALTLTPHLVPDVQNVSPANIELTDNPVLL